MFILADTGVSAFIMHPAWFSKRMVGVIEGVLGFIRIGILSILRIWSWMQIHEIYQGGARALLRTFKSTKRFVIKR